jgi:hypothetical protein
MGDNQNSSSMGKNDCRRTWDDFLGAPMPEAARPASSMPIEIARSPSSEGMRALPRGALIITA